MVKNYIDLDVNGLDNFVREGVSVVDFWAKWCGPCKIMEPIFEESAEKMKGNARFGKVDVDSNTELAQRFGVMSIPTMIFFKNGEAIDRIIGVINKEDLIKRIEGLTDTKY